MEKVSPVIDESWKAVLSEEFEKDYFLGLKSFLLEEKRKYRIFPPGKLIFNAFDHTPFDQVKVVLLGQDPYHGAGHTHGPRKPGRLTPEPWMGNIYRCSHYPAFTRTERAGICPLGKLCNGQTVPDRCFASCYPDRSAPVTPVGTPGIFRMRTFFADQQFVAATGR